MYKFPEETLKALRENRLETLDFGALGFKGKAALSGHKDRVTVLAALPDGRLASGSNDKTIRLWNVSSGVCEATLSEHKSRVLSLAILPDGRLASGSYDQTIRLWNVRSGKCEAILSEHKDAVSSLALLPDGRLVSGALDTTILLWNVRSGACEEILSGHEDSVFSLALLPDERLALGSYKEIRLWSVRSGACEAPLSGHEGYVSSLVLLPDGRLASAESFYKTVRLWNVISGVSEATLSGHTKSVTSLAMLPDGRLASGSWDNTIRLWNVSSGKCEAILSHENAVISLAVLSDGRLAAGEGQKSDASEVYIRLWPIAPDKSLYIELKSALESNNTLKKIEWSGCESLFNDEEHAWLKALLERNQTSKIAVSPLPPALTVIAVPEVTGLAAGGAGAIADDATSELAKLNAELAARDALLAAKELEEKRRIAELEEKNRKLTAFEAKPVVASIFTIIPSKDLVFGEKLGEGSFVEEAGSFDRTIE